MYSPVNKVVLFIIKIHKILLLKRMPSIGGQTIQRPTEKGQTMILDTLHRKLQIAQDEHKFNIILLQIKKQWDWTKSYHNLWTVLSLQIIHI